MISMFTDFKLWYMGSVTNILSVIKNNFCYVVFDKKSVLSITPMGAMSHATAIPQLQWCYPVIVYNQHLVMVISSSVSHAAIGMVQ